MGTWAPIFKKNVPMKRVISKAYKFRIYPNRTEREYFSRCFGHTRFLYNKLLAEKGEAYKKDKTSISKGQSQKRITELKKDVEFSWLSEVHSQVLQGANHDLYSAFDRFFKKIGGAGYPRFKKKGVSRDSFSVPQNFSVDPVNNFITIPKLKTPIKTIFHRSLKRVSKINSFVISCSASGKYYVSINVYEEISHKKPISRITKKTKTVGLDLGITDLLASSNGDKINNPRHMKNSEKRLKAAQRKLSKKVKGSKNRNKARLKVARIHEKIKCQRSDFLHKTSSKIVNENQVIFLEDLNVKGMMKNRKLSKAIGDVSWGEFVRQLKYKSEWTGTQVFQIGRFEPSSKLCSTKGCDFKHTKESLPLCMRMWACPDCGVCHDRDINAAKNIEIIGRDTAEFKPVEKLAAAISIKPEKQADSVKQESLAS